MKLQTTSILAALAGLSFAAGSANAMTLADNITNGDFASTISTNTGGGDVSLSDATLVDQWGFNQGGTALNWSIVGGVASYDATTTTVSGPRTRVLVQVIDGGVRTGVNNLNFDIQITDLPATAQGDTDMGLYLYGWNTAGTAPEVDFGETNGKALAGVVNSTGTAVSLLSASPFVIFENGAIVASGVDQVAGFNSVSVSADFDTGYQNIAVIFAVSYAQGNGATIVEIDNVAFATVPEPSSSALLGLGGLALILRRRK